MLISQISIAQICETFSSTLFQIPEFVGANLSSMYRKKMTTLSVHTNGCVEHGFRLVIGADGTWSKVKKQVKCTLLPSKIGNIL